MGRRAVRHAWRRHHGDTARAGAGPGKFWALPQSPQQLKQILMYGGIDRYFQIARAYRDEDPRADRVVEHSQLDVEMAFVEREEVMTLIEDLYTGVVERFSTKPLMQKPWPRMTFAEAMRRFGSDKPDLRLGMELVDLTGAFPKTAFAVVRDVIAKGGVVLIMTLGGTENIREVQAFPKTQTGYDPLLDAPAPITQAELDDLGLRVVGKPQKA